LTVQQYPRQRFKGEQMPFDGTGFPARPDQPRRSNHNDNIVSLIIIALAFCLLLMPIPLVVLIDIARYLQAG